MADRHQQAADDDGAALAEHAVGEEAAEERGQVDERRCRGRRCCEASGCDVERAEHEFERALERGVAEDGLDARPAASRYFTM